MAFCLHGQVRANFNLNNYYFPLNIFVLHRKGKKQFQLISFLITLFSFEGFRVWLKLNAETWTTLLCSKTSVPPYAGCTLCLWRSPWLATRWLLPFPYLETVWFAWQFASIKVSARRRQCPSSFHWLAVISWLRALPCRSTLKAFYSKERGITVKSYVLYGQPLTSSACQPRY